MPLSTIDPSCNGATFRHRHLWNIAPTRMHFHCFCTSMHFNRCICIVFQEQSTAFSSVCVHGHADVSHYMQSFAFSSLRGTFIYMCVCGVGWSRGLMYWSGKQITFKEMTSLRNFLTKALWFNFCDYSVSCCTNTHRDYTLRWFILLLFFKYKTTLKEGRMMTHSTHFFLRVKEWVFSNT